MFLHKPVISKHHRHTVRIIYIFVLVVALLLSVISISVIYTKQIAFELLWYEEQQLPSDVYTIAPFPISVYPAEKIITKNTAVQTYLQDTLLYTVPKPLQKKNGIIAYIIAKLAQHAWYQNLASPTGRILVIRPGARKEEVTQNFAQILHWDKEMQETFQALVVSAAPAMTDGKFFPAHYLVGKDATPEEVATLLTERFNSEVSIRYTPEVDRVVSIEDALIIASLLEKEAYDFTDMQEISGIIWNRLFIGMKLQIDATLQYANGTSNLETWYPQVRPEDKYIDSPFNTYKHKGLPPSPIGSPSTEAILAALNPIPTNCLFYFHDKESKFHCSETYKEHVQLLKQYYGQGK
jgi:UPF0755 protein